MFETRDLTILLSRYAEIEALKSDIQGMLAKNVERINEGMSAAYDERNFYHVSEQIRAAALPNIRSNP